MKCHAINKAGGNIGPDLGPIGGSSPLDYIITSVLDPSAAIKEEYLTKVITTTTGQIVTGIVVERNKNVVVLKDATGKAHPHRRLPTSIGEQNGKSLMPEGITRTLTRPRAGGPHSSFVSELGKPGPYAVRTPSTIQRWKWLHSLPPALRQDIPNREIVRDAILAAHGQCLGDRLRPGRRQVAAERTCQSGPAPSRLSASRGTGHESRCGGRAHWHARPGNVLDR